MTTDLDERIGFKITDYTPDYQVYFKSLNLAWIEKFFVVEDIDEKVLSDPDTYIYKDGGCILMALIGDKIIGTVALKRTSSSSFEMTKMAVDEAFRGSKVGYNLALAAIEKAKELGAKELILYSQTVLVPAINLYRKLGFKEVSLEPGKYQRCNIKMKISFEEQKAIESLTKRLKDAVEDAWAKFKSFSEEQWNDKPDLYKWSRKEVLGHLIDSASSNHQRFVRIQHEDDKNFPGYAQDDWVNIQNYQNSNSKELLNLWYSYNLHLTHVIANLHYDTLYTRCKRGDLESISFHDLIDDYIVHLKHHVGQIVD